MLLDSTPVTPLDLDVTDLAGHAVLSSTKQSSSRSNSHVTVSDNAVRGNGDPGTAYATPGAPDTQSSPDREDAGSLP